MKLEDIDIDVTCLVRLRPITRPSTTEQIEIDQEETRINYYLHHYAEQIEQALKSGKKINMINLNPYDAKERTCGTQ